MVLYLAREYKSAGVVSRIATTRKKVEGIKRCSLLFDRERRRFLFAKRAFSRFDVLAFFVLLRLFSLSLFCDIFLLCAHQIRLASFGLVEQKKKRAAAKQRKRERVCWREEKTLFPLFFLLFIICPTKRRRTQKARLLRVERERSPKKKIEKKKPAKAKQTTKRREEEREEKGRAIVSFSFSFASYSSSRGALPLEVRESSSFVGKRYYSRKRQLFSERVSRRKRERICAFFSKGERAILLSWKF